MRKELRYLIILFCIAGLISVRAFVEPLLYDPFLDYFKGDYLIKPFPELNYFEFFLNITYRYGLNSIFSIGIIYALFSKKETAIFSLKIFLISFIFLTIGFYCLLKFNLTTNYLIIFYIRRFLIHPLILLLLIPAFYYQFKNVQVSN